MAKVRLMGEATQMSPIARAGGRAFIFPNGNGGAAFQ
jgi:hypothetical protein